MGQEAVISANKPPTVMSLSETQQTAFTITGTMAVLSSMYWLQKFYLNHWMHDKRQFMSWTRGGVDPNWYTYWSIGDTINVLVTAIIQTIAAIAWLMSPYNPTALWSFIAWQTLVHYIEGIKWVIVAVFRFIAFFGDHPRSYEDGYKGIYSETGDNSKLLKVSKEHRL